jgi:predicted metalloprotease with PDZ domain
MTHPTVRPTALLLAVLLLPACASWTWRAPGRFPATSAEVPTHASLEDADLGPEAYAIGSTELQDRDLDVLLPRLAAQAARAGAHAVVIDDLEAVTSTWNTSFTPSERDAGVVARREEVQVSQSNARVEATALRTPDVCLGVAAVCDRPFAGQTCQARVVAVAGPGQEASIRAGNLILSVDGHDVGHPWDLHQRVDRSPVGTVFSLRVRDDLNERDVSVTSASCGSIYED